MNLLGQRFVLHGFAFVRLPVQLLPHGTLGGKEHCLVRICVPLPQVTEQLLQVVQLVKVPSTGNK